MSGVLVIGSSNTDMVVKTMRFPSPGETLLGGEFFMFSGGKGANQAVAAARAGAETSLICRVGDDIFGLRTLSELQKEGIHLEWVRKDQSRPSGIALIVVSHSGENEIVVASGANEALSVDDILAAERVLAASELWLTQLEIPLETVRSICVQARLLEKKLILNPAPARELPGEIYEQLFLITPNETEAELLTGIPVDGPASADTAAEILLGRGVRHVIITMGSEGAFFSDGINKMMVPAPLVQTVDTTGAGDTFNGVLASQLILGKNWEDAIRIACRAASVSVTRMGAQSSMPYRSELGE